MAMSALLPVKSSQVIKIMGSVFQVIVKKNQDAWEQDKMSSVLKKLVFKTEV